MKNNNITEQVKASYSAIASEFNQTRKQAWPEFEHFLTYVKKGSKILDVGCGNGRLYEALKGKEVKYVGIDHNPDLLQKAQENFPEAHFEKGDMVDLKLKSEAFDAVFCIAAFHHLPTPELRKKALSALHHTLKKDGILILTTWNLFQKKYVGELMKNIFRSLLSGGKRGNFNDFWIKWGKYPLKRYYHSFWPSELKGLFKPKEWKIEEFYFTKKGKRVSFLRSFNVVLIARKMTLDER